MDIGNHLREARLRRGLSLEQIARGTKVAVRALELIEANELGRLPGGISGKGYLRAYASEVGVDGEAVVRAYSEQAPAAALPEQLSRLAVRVSGPARRRWSPRLTTAALAALALLLLAAGYLHFHAAAVDPAETAIEPVPVQPVDGDATPAAVRDVDNEQVLLEIEPSGPCWVSATADGRLVLHRLLANGEHVTARARRELVLRIGDPGMFEFRINGRRGRLLGAPGKPVTVAITPDTAGEFVDEAVLRRTISST